MLAFSIYKNTSSGRRGCIHTPHGTVETPAFLFCATKATLKGLPLEAILAHNTQILLSNTYHLMVQPGSELVKKAGGIHRFMGWSGPVFTDSGGYQIFSLGHGSVSQEIKGQRGKHPNNLRSLTKITEDGAFFHSYVNGKKYFLSPESSITIQQNIGADLICVLDECTPFHVHRTYTERSMERSHRWAQRSLREFQKTDTGIQGLYGIVQGGIYDDLRKKSAEYINELPFFGHAIGGSLGKNKEQMYHVVGTTMQHLSLHRPIHLLGIGGMEDIFVHVKKGIDTFDCVAPTRLGRHGNALISMEYWNDAQEDFHGRHHIDLSKACFQSDFRPISSTCSCWTCSSYSRAYLHHLIKAKELLALTAITIHNVHTMNTLFSDIRHGIDTDTLPLMEKKWIG